MIRSLLTTTAMVAMMASTAWADDMAASDRTAMNEGQIIFDQNADINPMIDDMGFVDANDNQMLASNLIGSYVYNRVGDEAENIGDINDILVSRDGKIAGVIVGVGGFLGVGEKDVAIAVDKLSFRQGDDGERWIVSEYSAEALNGAPAFDRAELTETEAAMWQKRSSTIAQKNTGMMGMADSNVDMEETASTNQDEFRPISEASPLRTDNLIGMDVHASDGSDIGEVGDVIVDGEGKIAAVIIDVGGFLGMGEKPVAVGLENLMISRAEGMWDWSVVKTGLSQEALEAHPAYNEDTQSDNLDDVVLISPPASN